MEEEGVKVDHQTLTVHQLLEQEDLAVEAKMVVLDLETVEGHQILMGLHHRETVQMEDLQIPMDPLQLEVDLVEVAEMGALVVHGQGNLAVVLVDKTTVDHLILMVHHQVEIVSVVVVIDLQIVMDRRMVAVGEGVIMVLEVPMEDLQVTTVLLLVAVVVVSVDQVL